jgi:hypothetical protein
MISRSAGGRSAVILVEWFGFLIARQLLQRSSMPGYFFKSARKLGVVIVPICACLETIVALPGEPEAP